MEETEQKKIIDWCNHSYVRHWICAKTRMREIRRFQKKKEKNGSLSLNDRDALNKARGAYKVHTGIMITMENELGCKRYGKKFLEMNKEKGQKFMLDDKNGKMLL